MFRLSFFLATLISFSASAQNSYFFPGKTGFDPAIPSPKDFLGYPIGAYHTRHDRIVAYFEKLAEVSPMATIQTIGMTYEHRPMVVMTLSSESNMANLENIRNRHLQLSDPSKPMPDLQNLPMVIVLGYNVHGNEPSSSEAAMLTAYYLLASTDDEVKKWREQAIIHIEPVLNPDGRDRHTNWANMHKGNPLVIDPLDREHNEVWPSGRVNHYWFDLNRDWLPLVHVESQARIRFFHQWYPHVHTDYHEMGTNATYFFEPTKPFGSENPIVPRSNYEKLNGALAPYFAQSLDQIGSLYFTKEQYDNSYPGYGSTYQDIHGGLGLVFEQASSRGHAQQSTTKTVTFEFTIRNHVVTSLATLRGAVDNKILFQQHQRDFFKNTLTEGQKDAGKAWIFGDEYDASRNQAFLHLLLQHKVQVYENQQDITIGGQTFKSGSSWLVPTAQRQYLMVRSIFEPVKSFYDSVFYDASTWTMSLAYGLPYAQLTAQKYVSGNAVLEIKPSIPLFKESSYAYVFDWRDSQTAAVLYELLRSGIYVHTAFKPFTVSTDQGNKSFGHGSLMISVADQDVPEYTLHQTVKEAASRAGVKAYAISTGFSQAGIDLGSSNFKPVTLPKILMIVGQGVSQYEAGEIWHLFDSKLGMPITKADKKDMGRINLFQYNTLIMVNGDYSDLSTVFVNNLKTWLENGHTLIAQKSAVGWAIQKELVKEELLKDEPILPGRADYETARDYRGSRVIGGIILEADIDITHPVGFGYSNRKLPVWRNSNIFLLPSKNSFSTVAKYTAQPWLSGYLHPSHLENLKKSASIVVSKAGRGRVILMTDNPSFRGYWHGTNRLLINSLYFGSLVEVP